jgi:hypothetical protein
MLAAVGLDAMAAVLNAHAVLVASELDLRTPRRAPIDRHRIDDVSFAKELVTTPLYDEFMRRSGYKGLFALSFGLRHRATQLNLIYHLLSTTLRGEQSELRDALGDFDPGGGVVRTSLLEAEPWPVATPGRGPREGLPVVGFSAVGFYVVVRPLGVCRAFDAYDLPSCSAPAEGVYCATHAAEAWWHASPAQGSVQAKMQAFFARLASYGVYEENDLAAMVKQFWERLGVRPPT